MANPTGSSFLVPNTGYIWQDSDTYLILQTDQVEGSATGASFSGLGVENQPHQILLNKVSYLLRNPPWRNVNVHTIAGTFTFIVPSNTFWLWVIVVGGGGGGAGCNVNNFAGSGGAAGGYCEGILSVNPGQSFSARVGAGGAFGTATNISAGNGGQSTFGSMIANGGIGAGVLNLGGGNAQTSPAGPGGTASGGNILNATGSPGFSGTSLSLDGSTRFNAPASGAAGPWGGAGISSNSSVSYMNATAPGAGGGGAYGNFSNGGLGAAGIIIIRY